MESESINLIKDQKIDLTKTNPNLVEVALGLGWDANAGNGQTYDLDAFAITHDENNKPIDLIFYNHLHSSDGGVEHTGDNLTGEGDGDDETIKVHLNKIGANVSRISIGANIYDSNTKGHQSFGMVKNAFIRVYDFVTQTEILRYDLSEELSSANAMIFGSMYKYNDQWKFVSNSESKNGTLVEIFNSFK